MFYSCEGFRTVFPQTPSLNPGVQNIHQSPWMSAEYIQFYLLFFAGVATVYIYILEIKQMKRNLTCGSGPGISRGKKESGSHSQLNRI